MTDSPDLIHNFHTAVRRYVEARINGFDQIHWERGGVFTVSEAVEQDENQFLDFFSRIQFLSSFRWELIGIDPSKVTTMDEIRSLVELAAKIAFDFGMNSGESISVVQKAIQQEYDALSTHLRELSPDKLSSVMPLPYIRALSRQEQIDRLAAFGERWQVEVADGWFELDYYPLVSLASAALPPMEAFDAEALVEAEGTRVIQAILRSHHVERIYCFEENYPGIECEVSQLDVARAIPHIVSFIFSDTLDWMIYTSSHGTVTIGGEWLLDAVKQAWPQWQYHVPEYIYDIEEDTPPES
jgi:hypothetical protein